MNGNQFAAIRVSSYSTFFPWRSQTQSLLPGKFYNVERNVLVNICTTHEIESYVNVHPRAGVDGMEEAINDWASELNFIEVQCKSFWKEYLQSNTKLFFQFVEELDGGQHAAVRVGAATTNLQMLHWSNK